MKLKRKRPASSTDGTPVVGDTKYFSAVWARQSGRKHKVWTGDGFVEICGRFGQLRDLSGKLQGTTQLKADSADHLESGSRLHMGGNEAELVDRLSTMPIYEKLVSEVAEAKSATSDTSNDAYTNMLVDSPSISKDNENEPKKKKPAQQSVFKPILYLGTAPI